MMAGTPFLLILVVAAAVVVIVAVALVVASGRRAKRARAVPVCGGCGYQLAPNPMGLTVCPECGGDFLSVGILAPNMKLGRRMSPAIPLGIAWFIIVGVGMWPFYRHLQYTFRRQLSTTTVTQTSSGSGPFRGVNVNATREQLSDSKTPDALTATVAISGADGKELSIVVDGVSKTITAAPPATGLRGMAWDAATTKKIISMTGGGDAPDDESASKMRSIVDDAMDKTANSNPFGLGGGMLTSMSSSSTGFTTFRRPKDAAATYRESMSSSGLRSGSTPVIVIGNLRGEHWVIIITCATGLLLAFGGLWLIVLLTRQRRGGNGDVQLPRA